MADVASMFSSPADGSERASDSPLDPTNMIKLAALVITCPLLIMMSNMWEGWLQNWNTSAWGRRMGPYAQFLIKIIRTGGLVLAVPVTAAVVALSVVGAALLGGAFALVLPLSLLRGVLINLLQVLCPNLWGDEPEPPRCHQKWDFSTLEEEEPTQATLLAAAAIAGDQGDQAACSKEAKPEPHPAEPAQPAQDADPAFVLKAEKLD